MVNPQLTVEEFEEEMLKTLSKDFEQGSRKFDYDFDYY